MDIESSLNLDVVNAWLSAGRHVPKILPGTFLPSHQHSLHSWMHCLLGRLFAW